MSLTCFISSRIYFEKVILGIDWNFELLPSSFGFNTFLAWIQTILTSLALTYSKGMVFDGFSSRKTTEHMTWMGWGGVGQIGTGWGNLCVWVTVSDEGCEQTAQMGGDKNETQTKEVETN